MAVKKKGTTKKAVSKKTVSKQTVSKKTASKKAVSKKTTGKKAKVSAPATTVRAITEKQTKAQILTAISEETGIEKKDVAAVFSALGTKIHQHMKLRGSGEFTIPDAGIKVRRVIKPRTKARMGRNPFTGEEIKIPSKPQRKVIRLTALKSLKDVLE